MQETRRDGSSGVALRSDGEQGNRLLELQDTQLVRFVLIPLY